LKFHSRGFFTEDLAVLSSPHTREKVQAQIFMKKTNQNKKMSFLLIKNINERQLIMNNSKVGTHRLHRCCSKSGIILKEETSPVQTPRP